MDKWLFVGLGNPGNQYLMTRHNVGFMCLDRIAKHESIEFKRVYEGEIAELSNKYLLKPQTYMNDSGRSVRKAKEALGIENKNIVVIYDDMDIELGKIKIRGKGSSGGHNGVQSCLDKIGDDFIRLRVGIGRGDIAKNYVLEKFRKNEFPLLDEALNKAVEALQDITQIDLQKVMTKHN